MAKSKKSKNVGKSDKIRAKKGIEKAKKTLNAFEVHINKEKFKVMGKRSKNDVGLPGVSRAKAMKKRKETLGLEYKLQNKTNSFMDKRIGEKSNSLNEEDRILARFAAERIKQHKSKQSIFNLAEEELLTHRGQTLEEIEKYDDPRSDDEDIDTDGKKYGGLHDEFVSEGHFGGGVLSKTVSKDGAKSRKDLIEQLIAESKKRKVEKQKLRDSTLDLTQKLDSDWRDLQPLIVKRTDDASAIDSVLKQAEKKNADYDKTMRELKFEARGTPSDRLKSETEIAKKDKERLEKLEQERLDRMNGLTEEDRAAAKKHRSADDLDDGIELDEEPGFMVAYDADGNPLMPEQFLAKGKEQLPDHSGDAAKSNGNDDTDTDDESEDDDVDSFEDLKEGSSDEDSSNDECDKDIDSINDEVIKINGDGNDPKLITLINKINSSKDSYSHDESNEKKVNKISKETEIDGGNSANSKKCSYGNKSYDEYESTENDERKTLKRALKGSVENQTVTVKKSIGHVSISDQTLNVTEKSQMCTKRPRSGSESEKTTNSFEDIDESEANRINADLLHRKALMEKAANELPYMFAMPESYEALQELLTGKSAEQQYVILERVIKCNHPSLSEENKVKLNALLAYLLQYVNDIFSADDSDSIENAFKVFDRICPAIYDLAHLDPANASNSILEVIKEKYSDYKNNAKNIPPLDTLIFFKLVSLLFPTSDFRHPVVTPCYIFMEHILTKSRIRNCKAVSLSLFVLALVLEYTALSKKILTSAITFLRGLLHMCVFTSILNSSVVIPPFKQSNSASNLLVLSNDCSDLTIDNYRLLLKDLSSESCEDSFKIRTLSVCTKMIKEFFDNCNTLTGQSLLFSPHIQLLNRLDLELYPKFVVSQVMAVKDSMESFLASKNMEPLRPQQKKPRVLKLYEPVVEEIFDGKVRSKKSKEKLEHDKLVHKLRKEKKGAMRELRRDKAYIGTLKIKQKLQSDQVRKEKVQQIYKEASVQQGELNKLQRTK